MLFLNVIEYLFPSLFLIEYKELFEGFVGVVFEVVGHLSFFACVVDIGHFCSLVGFCVFCLL